MEKDVDIVWMKDPLPLINGMTSAGDSYDIVFMDDGARYSFVVFRTFHKNHYRAFLVCSMFCLSRTPRFTPMYVNSGFYFVRTTSRSIFLLERMIRAVSDISVSHSHQSVLTRYVTETIDFCGLKFGILDMREFPSGYIYHHEKEYMAQFKAKSVHPSLFHMCWTESRVQKVR